MPDFRGHRAALNGLRGDDNCHLFYCPMVLLDFVGK
jgi:hypothetical protein